MIIVPEGQLAGNRHKKGVLRSGGTFRAIGIAIRVKKIALSTFYMLNAITHITIYSFIVLQTAIAYFQTCFE